MPFMLGTRNPVNLRLSPSHHARACLLLAAALFALAAGAYFWNEAVHCRLYVGLGLVFALLGLAPFLAHLSHGRPKGQRR